MKEQLKREFLELLRDDEEFLHIVRSVLSLEDKPVHNAFVEERINSVLNKSYTYAGIKGAELCFALKDEEAFALRMIAVEASTDPRSVRKYIRREPLRGMAHERIEKALIRFGASELVRESQESP